MLLVVDIGNTNTVLGVFNDKKLEFRYRVATNLKRTSDELVATLLICLLYIMLILMKLMIL